jgi:hypothetical protein
MNWIHLAQFGPVAGSCVHSNEPSGSVRGFEFLDYLSIVSGSEEELCSMELFCQSVSATLRETAGFYHFLVYSPFLPLRPIGTAHSLV